jgi:hypothetical protein
MCWFIFPFGPIGNHKLLAVLLLWSFWRRMKGKCISRILIRTKRLE